MTLVVATAMGDTPDELYEAARAAARDADWVEVRLDGPSGLPWDLRPFFAVPKPCVATVRHADDGGRSHADDATRAAALRRALKAGARAIDVETTHGERDALVAEAKAAGARVVLSRHDLAGTPGAAEMLDELRAMRAKGADWCKLATRVDGPADAAALVEAAHRARAEGIPFALMAVNDPFLRLLAPALGMALAYASVPGRPAASPGQVPADRLRAAHALHRAPRGATGATRVAFLLGHPVARSKSPAMQGAAFAAAGIDAAYAALDVAPADLAPVLDGLRRAGALGLNLTAPHKVAAVPLMHDLADAARAAGAVNTVEIRDGRLVGHNTDGDGAVDALREAGARLAGEAALVLGAGGTARAVARALRETGAQVIVAGRTPGKAQEVAKATGASWLPWDEVPRALPRVAVLVNATTVGTDGASTPVDPAALGTHAVLDCVYVPGGTPLVRAARAHGLVAVPGESMLLWQGVRAFEIWTGRPAPVGAMRAALEGAA